ncbi:MAG: thermonuclease family protein [Planctomycetota bacterium]|jgi:endonuclease YncB( thermonuclease family)
MRRALLPLFFGLWLAACVQPPTAQEELELERGLRLFGYRLVRVIDGNTLLIDLNDQGLHREVRLIGVDSPRYKKEFKEGGGHDAGEYLMRLLAMKGGGKTASGEPKPIYLHLKFEGWRYGPLIDPKTLRPVRHAQFYPAGAVLNTQRQIEAYVFLEGHLINRLMIDSGYARVDRRIEFSRKEEFLRAEERAKKLRLGYWHWSLIE